MRAGAMWLAAAGLMALCVFADEVVHLLGGTDFHKAAAIIMPITRAANLYVS